MGDFLEQVWRLVLRRGPDRDAVERLRRGDVSRSRLVPRLVDVAAGAVLVAELRPKRLTKKLRLAACDVRHPGEPRRSTAP